jgi:hypothetical protein
MTRRHFLGHLRTTALALPAMHFFSALEAQAQAGKKPAKRMILLWMGGGPSQLDTWDLKPESEKNGGEFKPIETTAPGVLISEHLPKVAKQMKHLAILRSLNSKEGNHDRGTYMMHTGYAPNPTVVHPAFGSVLSYELGAKLGEDFPLPHCIAINSPGEGAGFLGMAHTPFFIQNPTAPIANMTPPRGVNPARQERRLAMLGASLNDFGAVRKGATADHKAVYNKTIKMMNSKYTDALRLDGVPDRVRDAYGRNSFGQGCLMARNLVEAGVTYVEVSLGGWDNHADIFQTLSGNLLPQLDQAMGALVEDLARSGLLEHTLVVWMGEFGRTPRINQTTGRDHWPRSWSVVMGGAGIKGGQAVGATDKDGIDVIDRELGVMDVVATMCRALGVDLDTEYTTPRGRPYKVVDGGKPISELF